MMQSKFHFLLYNFHIDNWADGSDEEYDEDEEIGVAQPTQQVDVSLVYNPFSLFFPQFFVITSRKFVVLSSYLND
jgi:hypothetical protein